MIQAPPAATAGIKQNGFQVEAVCVTVFCKVYNSLIQIFR